MMDEYHLKVFEVVNEETSKPVIPIRKLYVSAANAYPNSEEEVRQVFSRYGSIKLIHLRYQGVFFFVTFVNAKDAMRALKDKNRLFNRFRYAVKPADSWHQPLELNDGTIIWDRRFVPDKPLVVDTSYDPSKPSLMDLVDDVLLLVLNKLTLKECIRLEGVCTRMRSLCYTRYASVSSVNLSDIKELRLYFGNNFVTLDRLRQIILRCGSNLKKLNLGLHISFELERAAPQIGKYCRNLTELRMPSTAVSMQSLQLFSSIIPKLEVLEVDCTFLNSTGYGSILELGTNLKELKILNKIPLRNFDGFNASEHSLKKLKTLYFDGHLSYKEVMNAFPNVEVLECFDLTFDMVEGGDANPLKLKKLTLTKMKSSNRSLALAPHLEYLKVINSQVSPKFIESISQLESLKALSLCHTEINSDDMESLATKAKWRGKLEEFSCHASPVTRAAIVSIFDSNPNLTRLNISYCAVDQVQLFHYMHQKHRARYAENGGKALMLRVEMSADVNWPADDSIVNIDKFDSIICRHCISLDSDDEDDDAFDDFLNGDDDDDDDWSNSDFDLVDFAYEHDLFDDDDDIIRQYLEHVDSDGS